MCQPVALRWVYGGILSPQKASIIAEITVGSMNHQNPGKAEKIISDKFFFTFFLVYMYKGVVHLH